MQRAVTGVLRGSAQGQPALAVAPEVSAGPMPMPMLVVDAAAGAAPLRLQAAVAAMTSAELSRVMLGSRPLNGRAFTAFDGSCRAAAAAVWRADGPAALEALSAEGGDVRADVRKEVAQVRARLEIVT